MREYGKVSGKFWIGETGKKIRAAGADAQVVALYLMTGPHTNMLGLYYVAKMTIGHETGLGLEGASKALERCIEAGFCAYDEATEMVWVYEMASYQIADSLSPNDNRCTGVQNEYNGLLENPYLARFFERYQAAFHMKRKRGEGAENISPLQAPPKPLGSQEQEQEKEQDKNIAPSAPKFSALKFLLDRGVEKQTASDWLAVRKLKKLASTATAFEDVASEVAKAGLTMQEAILHCCKHSWGGFKAKWPRDGSHPAEEDNRFKGAK